MGRCVFSILVRTKVLCTGFMAEPFAALDKAIGNLVGDKDPADSSEFLKVISSSSSPKDK
jgi:hypothetical protein